MDGGDFCSTCARISINSGSSTLYAKIRVELNECLNGEVFFRYRHRSARRVPIYFFQQNLQFFSNSFAKIQHKIDKLVLIEKNYGSVQCRRKKIAQKGRKWIFFLMKFIRKLGVNLPINDSYISVLVRGIFCSLED